MKRSAGGGGADILAFEPMFYGVAVVAVILTGISKSGLGGGLGQLSVPLMAIFISPVAAAAIMLPILCLIDVVNLWGYRRHWSRADVAVMLPGALIGVLVGGLTYRYLNEHMVRLLLGGITIVFVLILLRRTTPATAGYVPGKKAGFACGMVSGFTSFVAHAGGAPIKFYLLPKKMPKRLFVGTHVFFFFAVNQMKLWPYFLLGQFTPENLRTSLLLVPAVPVGILIGYWLVRVVSIELFYNVIYGLLLVAGAKLIWDGLTGMGYL